MSRSHMKRTREVTLEGSWDPAFNMLFREGTPGGVSLDRSFVPEAEGFKSGQPIRGRWRIVVEVEAEAPATPAPPAPRRARRR